MGSLLSFKGGEGRKDVVPVGFDEGILRGLCDMDVGSLSRVEIASGVFADERTSVRYRYWQIG